MFCHRRNRIRASEAKNPIQSFQETEKDVFGWGSSQKAAPVFSDLEAPTTEPMFVAVIKTILGALFC